MEPTQDAIPHSETNTFARLRDLIASDQTKSCLDHLLEYLTERKSPYQSEAILLSSRFYQLNRKERIGEEIDIGSTSKLLHSILHLINEIEEDEKENEEKKGKESPYETAPAPKQDEEKTWEITSSLNQWHSFLNFLHTYPTSPHGYTALARIATLNFEMEKSIWQKQQNRTHPWPFAGREEELGILEEKMLLAKLGQFHLACISGETGQGKSALAKAFARKIKSGDPAVQVLFGKSYWDPALNSQYHCFKEMNRHLISEHRRRHLTPGLKKIELNPGFAKVVEILLSKYAGLIGPIIPRNTLFHIFEKYVPTDSNWLLQQEQQIKQAEPLEELELFELYASFLKEVANIQPLLIVLESLQNAEEGSLRLLNFLSQALKSSPIMVLFSFNPQTLLSTQEDNMHPLIKFMPQWKQAFGDFKIDLDNQPAEKKRALLDAQINAYPNHLDSAFRASLLGVTGGNPLFNIEMLRYFREEGHIAQNDEGYWVQRTEIPWDHIPLGIEAVLEERLGFLDSDQYRLLQLASLQGNAFQVEALARLLQQEEKEVLLSCSTIIQGKNQLLQEESLVLIGQKYATYFRFDNHLLQKFLYNQLTESERRIHHQELAEILEEILVDEHQTFALQLAKHHRIGTNFLRAAHFLYIAAQHSQQISAYTDAAKKLRQALALVELVPKDDESQKIQLKIICSLCIALKSYLGWNAPEVQSLSTQGIQLSQTLEDPSLISSMFFGWFGRKLLELKFQEAEKMAQGFLALGNKKQDSHIQGMAFTALANVSYWQGDPQASLAYLTRFGALELIEDHENSPSIPIDDSKAYSVLFTCLSYFQLGKISEARNCLKAALELYDDMNRPFQLAIILQAAAWLHFDLKEHKELEVYAVRLLVHCQQYQFTTYLGIAKMFLGAASIRTGKVGEGRILNEQGYEEYTTANQGKIMHAIHALIQAEANIALENFEAGLEAIELSISLSKETGELCYITELLRMKALFLEKLQQPEAAYTILLEALQLSINKMTHSFSLRIVLNIHELNLKHKLGNDVSGLIPSILEQFEDCEKSKELAQALNLPN